VRAWLYRVTTHVWRLVNENSPSRSRSLSLRKLIVSEWIALGGVFDADTMEQWFNQYHSDAAEAITKLKQHPGQDITDYG
jgi:hypothetical protein